MTTWWDGDKRDLTSKPFCCHVAPTHFLTKGKCKGGEVPKLTRGSTYAIGSAQGSREGDGPWANFRTRRMVYEGVVDAKGRVLYMFRHELGGYKESFTDYQLAELSITKVRRQRSR